MHLFDTFPVTGYAKDIFLGVLSVALACSVLCFQCDFWSCRVHNSFLGKTLHLENGKGKALHLHRTS